MRPENAFIFPQLAYRSIRFLVEGKGGGLAEFDAKTERSLDILLQVRAIDVPRGPANNVNGYEYDEKEGDLPIRFVLRDID